MEAGGGGRRRGGEETGKQSEKNKIKFVSNFWKQLIDLFFFSEKKLLKKSPGKWIIAWIRLNWYLYRCLMTLE